MNTTELPVRPDVSTFVARVRDLLADLPEEERLELTEGLEADLGDQVAEHGGGVLGDPDAYARELRAAAGLDPTPRRRHGVINGATVGDRLDAAGAWWDAVATRPRVAPAWTVVAALRPVWWVARAWVATVLLLRVLPGWDVEGLLWVPGVPAPVALAFLVLAVVLSTLIGLGRLWPGARAAGSRGTAARVVLLALNAFAVAVVPVALNAVQDAYWVSALDDVGTDASWVSQQGVLNRGRQVCNLAAYDAEGQPLVGVQLFDQDGHPLDVRCWDQQATKVPWVLGDVTRWNVFPLGERDRPARRPERRAELEDAAFPVPDRATTPAVTNPLAPPAAEKVQGDGNRDGRTRAALREDDERRAGGGQDRGSRKQSRR